MNVNQIIRQSTILVLSGMFIFGCKKTTDQSSVESVSTTSQKPLSLAANETQGSMNYFTTVRNTDYLSVGTGGLSEDGYGQIRILGTFPLSKITKVYLYWHLNSNEDKELGKTIKFNKSSLTGTEIGVPGQTKSYRSDVTALVRCSSSRIFTLKTVMKDIVQGASLILFYSDGISSNNRDIVLYNGDDTNGGASYYNPNNPGGSDLTGWNVVLSGVKYTSGKVNVTMHVAGGDLGEDGGLYLNNSEIGGQLLFEGRTVPGGTPKYNGFWDIIPLEVSSLLKPGINSMQLTMPFYYDDYLALIALVFNLPKGAAPNKVLQVSFDYKLAGFPNTIPGTPGIEKETAILGTSTFDVNQVDRSSIRLNAVPFISSRIRDINGDGFNDLEMYYDVRKVLGTFPTQGPQIIKLTLTGTLLPQYESTPIEGVVYI